jgi:septal ring-binding cell division protein DamX
VKPVPENSLIKDSFFLTRQTANLLEDFTREINKSSSLFLLYGVASVGKSRLLRELTNRGISGRKFHWLDFKSEMVDPGIKNESPDAHESGFASKFQALMEAAEEHDVIIVDHFELASNESRHRLFHSWSIDGINKKIKLIIAATAGSFDDLREFAQQFKIEIKSFELVPCSMAEVEAFLAFYLFPKNPLSRLSIPSDVEKQLQSCNGILSKVAEVAIQQAKLVSIKTESDLESKNYTPLAIGLVLIVLIAIGTGYRYWMTPVSIDDSSSSITDQTVTIVSDNDDVVAINAPEPIQSSSAVETIASIDSPQIVEPERETEPVIEPVVQASEKNLSQENLAVEPEPIQVEPEVVKIEPEVVKVDEPVELEVSNKSQQLSRFHRDLDNSLHWIESQDKSKATIQIMMIGFKNFNGKAYYDYLDSLLSKNIDISRFKIYQTSLNGSVVFGVIYGEYKNRRDAYQHIKQLPEVLKKTSPITRTIGGIWNEINGR